LGQLRHQLGKLDTVGEMFLKAGNTYAIVGMPQRKFQKTTLLMNSPTVSFATFPPISGDRNIESGSSSP
jgi:uncharacterized protein YaaQ